MNKIKCNCGGNFEKTRLLIHIESALHNMYESKKVGEKFYYYYNSNNASLFCTSPYFSSGNLKTIIKTEDKEFDKLVEDAKQRRKENLEKIASKKKIR